jgi:hypothetical protein
MSCKCWATHGTLCLCWNLWFWTPWRKENGSGICCKKLITVSCVCARACHYVKGLSQRMIWMATVYLTLWSRIHFEKLVLTQLYCCNSASLPCSQEPWDPTVSPMNPAHILLSFPLISSISYSPFQLLEVNSVFCFRRHSFWSSVCSVQIIYVMWNVVPHRLVEDPFIAARRARE